MLADYSSLLECLAAVYFTMCLDKVLTNKIWTGEFYGRFAKVLEEMDVQFSANEKVIEINNGRVQAIQKCLTNLSIFMMAVIIGLLFLCGYESGLEPNSMNIDALHFTITVVMTIVGVATVTMKRIIFNSWKKATILFVLSFIVASCLILCHVYGRVVTGISDLCIKVTVLSLVLPIVIQVIECWAYKNLYYGYIRSIVKRSALTYKKALADGFEGKDKDLILENLNNQIIDRAKRANVCRLCVSWALNHFQKLFRKEPLLF